MLVFLRRRGLGLTSCREMARNINEMGGEARVVRNDNLDSIGEDDVVVRWGCTSTIPRRGVTVINSAESIHNCNDKLRARVLMQDAGVPVPATYTAPNQISNDDCDSGIVIRPVRHAQGRNLYVTYGYDSLVTKLRELNYGEGNYYLSALIEKVAEYRVFVANGRAVWVAEKTPGNPDDVAWNVARGGRFDNVKWSEWPMPAVRAAVAASNVIGTDFAGVDVMLDAEGRAYVLELNSAPSQTSPYRQLCSAKAFKWMHDHRGEALPVAMEGGWKEYIHPAIRN